MPRSELTPEPITRSGADQVPTVGSADGFKFANTGRVIARVTNTNVSVARSVTFLTSREVDGLAVDDLDVNVPTSSARLIGPFPPATFNVGSGNPDAGMVYMDCDPGGESDLEIELYSLT